MHSILAAVGSFTGPIIPSVSDANGNLQTCAAGFGGLTQIIGGALGLAISLGILIAVLVIAYAGFLLVLNPVNPENRTTAKKMLINAAIGFIITLCAWLLVNTFLNVLGVGGISGATKTLFGGGSTCLAVHPQKGIDGGAAGGTQTGGGGGTTCPTGQSCQSSGKCGPAQTTCGSATCTAGQVCNADNTACMDPQTCTAGSGTTGGNEDQVRQQLAAASVTINKGVCSPPDDHSCGGTPPSCTDVGGMQSATVSQIINVANACPGCGVQVTGGTEPGHACGTYSHGNGYKVDLHPTSGLDSLLKSLNSLGTRTGDSPGPAYGDSCGNQYVRESDHWDITIKATCSVGH